jgi:hypothetical protein
VVHEIEKVGVEIKQMVMYGNRGDFSRLMQIVLAAQDFGLTQVEARAIAEEALERTDALSDACDWTAALLAERVLDKVRIEVPNTST